MTECQYGCGKELVWDKSRKSDSGKMIPIEKATNEPHNCPNSPYNKKQGGTTQPEQKVQQTMDSSQANLSLAERLEVLENRFGKLSTDFVDMLVRVNKLDKTDGA